ncbi:MULTISPECIES: PP0621 family protein [unclassified Duganella]|uniref:PP0621 family protein n=1 Tax=unclassified Duganella TaxID=2636909 RepID=UPI00088566FD|nr:MULTISPECIES: PP0621 family protein [unclassified Duganella]SDG26667.1 uncharacterized protein SAMN05216320_103436 [Duganella sp. OV458]SDJ21234.1 uncharacterized protein SAMN05428973_10348 [Duganella sp. OV510]
MTKLLVWLALAALVIFAIRSKFRQAQKRYQDQFRQQQQQQQAQAQPQPQQTYKARAAAQAANDAEVMLQCAHCGVFFPASEAVQANGRDYCSAAHAALPSA